jgi:hypothetical protein
MSQETHVCASTACDWEIFTFLYVDGFLTAQETYLLTSTVSHRDSFPFRLFRRWSMTLRITGFLDVIYRPEF